MDVKAIVGRQRDLFVADFEAHAAALTQAIRGARVLVFGGAGSIGKEVALQVVAHEPAALDVIDISENNLVELVREIRSSVGYTSGDMQFLPLDMGGPEAEAFLAAQKPYDYVLNLAAMKHVRSEKDAYSLMRMIKVNVLDTATTLKSAAAMSARKYFAVSTDKAQNPANLMGATKRIMEDMLFASEAGQTVVSTARFANVAFSDGSLLHGFRQRLVRRQPISAPVDTRRYFVTGEESGILCLLSTVLGAHREIFFPKLDPDQELETFSVIAERFLRANGFEPVSLPSEDEARRAAPELIAEGKWPCYFFKSDTSGEKPFEEFFAPEDDIDWDRFVDVGVIRSPKLSEEEEARAGRFVDAIGEMRRARTWNKAMLVKCISDACPGLSHVETGRSLDSRM